MRKVAGIVDGIFVEIYDRAVRNKQKSEAAGTPMFDTMMYIKKKAPNSRDIYDQPVKSTDHERYPELFEKLEKGEKTVLDGTPIEQWPALDVNEVETLKGASIFTVQQLADLPETSSHRLPQGFRGLKTKAEKWLNQGRMVEELQKTNQELEKRIKVLEANQKKKPGRPKKVEAA